MRSAGDNRRLSSEYFTAADGCNTSSRMKLGDAALINQSDRTASKMFFFQT